MKNFKPYLIELTIVTAGVLIALFLSNLKESNQVRKYYVASIETINIEIQDNYSNLKGVIKKQTNLLDTFTKYNDSQITILDLFKKSNGLQLATISNAGLDFYKKNQINSLDFKMMSTLILMNSLSEIIYTKVDKLIDFTYSNILTNSLESKTVVILHLQNVLESENQLLGLYKNFIDENIENKHNVKK